MAIHTQQTNPEKDLGFGPQPVIKNQPLINKDGSVNVKRKGLSRFNTADNYHTLIKMSWGKFWVVVLSGYLVANLLFASVYVLIGMDSLEGASGDTTGSHFLDAFFFSAQTISTVGYGHISPHGVVANSVAAFESMIGLLAFALATGLLYGRFSKPSAKIVYSENLLVAPYRDNSRGLMFRLANIRKNVLIDLDIEIIFSYNEFVDGKPIRRFFPLELERKYVSLLTLNWTIVHPLNAGSPLIEMTNEDLESSQASFSVLLKAFDDTFSQTVHSRTSYVAQDMVWNARFIPMFDREDDGRIALDMSKISAYHLLT
ncbi:ion channel [Mucilaginibacter phyllosphaerae]|uniref:Inward rectifier potassium channel n=1 Tax=Mucilaginibacter phyllosphaerae TaxID=1812349 RepID=A0A4Y8A935_9SPHI|nr:ion channel [Mucilaginibacter phyllosphaerae]MBB3970786.1 inward rectifier potassium channel [Mucilaginibacter phyllosphaerae]TEW64273.1 ion transporter [Mucilaginibacter phyllosphaerae]GGH04578.1 inward rectifier potassium channel Irk [Mucilaginibacter phyllosphaerae]